ncbi:unnamed protein product [Cunninghamella blakesleeana]
MINDKSNNNGNNQLIIKPKRKVSCIICRLKKVKCSGGVLPCEQCIKRNTVNQCVYPKQKSLGRPPKNAVINKLTLNRNKNQTLEFFNDFIIENLAYTIPTSSKFILNDKTKNINYFIESYFTDAFSDMVNNLALIHYNPVIAPLFDSASIKMFDLIETFFWTACEVPNILFTRFSSISLDNANDYNSVASAVIQDLTFKFYAEPQLMIDALENPLLTISHQEAVRLIECFFCVHPASIILNKTLLLQAFWTDSVDSLLLSTIYGIATYLSKLLEGKPVGLWEATKSDIRNIYLDYAYFLLNKATSEVNLSKFQAVVLLGLFESNFGYPKRGMTILGVAALISEKLGIKDCSYLSKQINEVEFELATIGHWLILCNNIRGCVDIGHINYHSKLCPPLPPVNVDKSKSYQLEKSSNNMRLFKSYYYLVETFYVCCVIAKFTGMFLRELPEVKHNMHYSIFPSHFRPKVGHPKPYDLVTRWLAILDEFDQFIQSTKHTWSALQTFTIELIWKLFDIHIIFIKNHHQEVPEGINFMNSSFNIFQDNDISMDRIYQSIPKVYSMLDYLKDYLNEPKQYYNQSTLLPRGVIITALETAFVILNTKFTNDLLDQTTFQYMKTISELADSKIWMLYTGIRKVQKKMEDFFKQHSMMNHVNNNNIISTPTTINDINDINEILNTSPFQESSSIESLTSHSPNSFTMDNQLALAAFFDPMSTWLTPMAQELPLDLLLWDNSNFNK